MRDASDPGGEGASSRGVCARVGDRGGAPAQALGYRCAASVDSDPSDDLAGIGDRDAGAADRGLSDQVCEVEVTGSALGAGKAIVTKQKMKIRGDGSSGPAVHESSVEEVRDRLAGLLP